MNKELKIGDLVILKSGGPIMTVAEMDAAYGPAGVLCKWFSGKKLESGRFPVASLEEPKEDK